MKSKTAFITFLLLSNLFLPACNWNRTEKAQRQIYGPGPDAPTPLIGTLQRNQDYYNKTDSELLEKMR